MMRVVTCYRPGGDFNEQHVLMLRENVREVFGVDLEVMRDERWPGWWCKMAMFEEPGHFLYCDLDTIFLRPLVIVKSMAVPEQTPVVIRDFYKGEGIGSGLMKVTPEMCERVWFDWNFYGPTEIMQSFRGDQDFLQSCYSPEEYLYWQDVTPGEVCSFKIHCQEQPPETASVICYHGKPRIHETKWATSGASRWRKISGGHGYLAP